MFVLGLLAVFLVGQEALFRWMFPLPVILGFNRVRYQSMAEDHPNFRDVANRGLVYDRLLFESRPDGYSEVHQLNLYGFRGADFAPGRPQGKRRVVFLGDSVTEGQGAPGSQTIPAEFARLVAEDGIPAEVINLGVVAASLPQYVAMGRDALPLLMPTDVVLVLFANDLPSPPYLNELDGPAARFTLVEGPGWLPRVVELIRRAVRKEPIYRRWPRFAVPFFAAVPDSSNPWSRSPASPPPAGLDPGVYQAMRDGALNPWLKEQSDAIPGMLSHDFSKSGLPSLYLYRLAECCKQINARLLIAYVPFSGVTHARYAPALVKLGMDPAVAAKLATDPAYRSQNRLLAGLCPKLDVPFVDTTDALIEAEAAGTPQFWALDTHPRPTGYATIARTIHEAWTRAATAR